MILVLDFGGQYAHIISRRVRELGVYSDVKPCDMSLAEIGKMKPSGIILSGGPSSVYEHNATTMSRKVLDLGIPILGICYGEQLIGKFAGGSVLGGKLKEFGKKILHVKKPGKLLKGLSRQEQVWMSHGDLIAELPKDFEILASTDACKIAAFENEKKKLYGIQFHAEVVHTPSGMQILKNFVFDICRAKKDWHIKNLAKRLIKEIKNKI